MPEYLSASRRFLIRAPRTSRCHGGFADEDGVGPAIKATAPKFDRSFPALRAAAAAIGIDSGPQGKPAALLELCEKAWSKPGSEFGQRAPAVQRAERQLLFDY
jgi:hypothetical protein